MKNRILLSFIICLFSLSAYSVADSTVWQAIDHQVKELRANSKYAEAISVVDRFTRQFPDSIFLLQAMLVKGDILAGDLNQVEDGFSLFEAAEQMKGGGSLKLQEYKKKYARELTVIRLGKIKYFLDRFFIDNINYPDSLPILAKKYPVLLNKLTDGFGFPFRFRLKDNPVYKGKDRLQFSLFSVGPDGQAGSGDDIFPEDIEEAVNDDFHVVDVIRKDDAYIAELTWTDEKRKLRKSKEVKEGDYVNEYTVFGINKNGVILVKNNKPLIIFKD